MRACTCDCSSGFDAADAMFSSLQRARKAHRCYECRRTIQPGQLYWRHVVMADRTVNGRYKLCRQCEGVCQDLCLGWHDWGYLWEIIHDCICEGQRENDPDEFCVCPSRNQRGG